MEQHRNRKRKCVTVCLLRSQLLHSGMCADQPYVINKSLDSHTHTHTHLQLDLYKCRIISTFLLFTFIWLERNAEIALKHLPGSSICVWQLDKYQDTRHTHTHTAPGSEWVWGVCPIPLPSADCFSRLCLVGIFLHFGLTWSAKLVILCAFPCACVRSHSSLCVCVCACVCVSKSCQLAAIVVAAARAPLLLSDSCNWPTKIMWQINSAKFIACPPP